MLNDTDSIPKRVRSRPSSGNGVHREWTGTTVRRYPVGRGTYTFESGSGWDWSCSNRVTKYLETVGTTWGTIYRTLFFYNLPVIPFNTTFPVLGRNEDLQILLCCRDYLFYQISQTEIETFTNCILFEVLHEGGVYNKDDSELNGNLHNKNEKEMYLITITDG